MVVIVSSLFCQVSHILVKSKNRENKRDVENRLRQYDYVGPDLLQELSRGCTISVPVEVTSFQWPYASQYSSNFLLLWSTCLIWCSFSPSPLP